MGHIALNLEGKKFGRLMASNQLRIHTNGRTRQRLCICDCGNQIWVATCDLVNGHTKSCGCWRNDFMKKAKGASARRAVIYGYKKSAQFRGLSWDLTDEQFDTLVSGLCFYCHRLPNTFRKTSGRNGTFQHNGIDRINNALGYTIDNVVSCCQICNFAKRDMSFHDFMLWIKDISEAYNAKQ